MVQRHEHASVGAPGRAAGDVPSVCTACSGAMKIRFASVVDPQTNESFGVAACRECGLGETYPQPADLGRYYGAAYYGDRHGFTRSYYVRRCLRMVRKIAGSADGRSLLDVGCGDGAFLRAAQRHGWNVAGTEMKPAILHGSGLRISETLSEAARHGPYDCITLWHSLEHMRSPRDVVEQSGAILKPGGTMLIAVPNAEGLQATVFGPRWFHLDVPRHLFHFGVRSLSRIVERAGLLIARYFHLELEFDLFGWTQSALSSLFAERNVFFNLLTGRPTEASLAAQSGSFAGGVVLTALAAPLAAAGPFAKTGATLVLAAHKPVG